jgi:glycolate oxidase
MNDGRDPRRGGEQFVDALGRLLPPERLIVDSDRLDAYRRDHAELIEPGWPVAAALPVDTAEVAGILRLANEHRVAVIPRGAGTGLSGGASATDGALILSLARMNKVLSIDANDLVAVVQPGVLNADLAKAVEGLGLMYAPDPASFEISSLGGNLATNAGGLRCTKYGVTRESTLGLEVVLPDGTCLRTGGRTVKQAAGYDLTALFVGSEGTLGVITEATLRLRPAPGPAGTLVAFFDDLGAAGRAVATISASGIVPSVVELMDRVTIGAVDEAEHLGLDRAAAAMLIVQSDAWAGGQDDLARTATVVAAAGGRDVVRSLDATEAGWLMAARRAALPALERLGAVLLEDVVVPRSRVPALIGAIEKIGLERGVTIGTFGHAADGNLHPTLVLPRGDAAAREQADAAANAIMEAAVELGGSITGEHGVGVLKRHLLDRSLDPLALALMRRIKSAIDPLGILNPGKGI